VRYGVSGRTALWMLQALADRASMNAGHNRGFDGQMVRIESMRADVAYPFADVPGKPSCEHVVGQTLQAGETACRVCGVTIGKVGGKTWEKFCTMKDPDCIRICRLPKARGGGFKWPKLEEAVPILLGRELEGAHDAMVDVRGAKDVFFELRRRKAEAGAKAATPAVWKPPEIETVAGAEGPIRATGTGGTAGTQGT